MTAELRALGRHVAAFEDGLGEPEPNEALRTLLAGRALAKRVRPRPRLGHSFATGLAAGFATALAGWWLMSRLPTNITTPQPSFKVGFAAQAGTLGPSFGAADAEVPLRFFEGSEVRLEPNAYAHVTRLDARGAEVTLESGTAHVAVTPRPGARWLFRSGPFTVDVKGTRFDIAWDEPNDAFRLRLRAGKVTLLGCGFGAGQTLSAGQEAQASCRAHTSSVASFQPATAAASDALEMEATPDASGAPAPNVTDPGRVAPRLSVGSVVPPAKPAATHVAAPSWLELARSGRYAEAYAALQAADFDRERRKCGPVELLALADSARLSGHVAGAASAYHEVRDRYRGTPAAAEAAFDLGRLAAERTEHSDAARWFRAYLDEAPDGPLRAAALGRLLETELDLGHADAARRAAAAYLARYPLGPHADVARRALENDAAR